MRAVESDRKRSSLTATGIGFRTFQVERIDPRETTAVHAAPTVSTTGDRLSRLEHQIAEAGELLPAQGPITNYIHQNTLQAFEHLSFAEGVKQGAALFGCQPYLLEDQYHEYLGRGRIRAEDLAWVLEIELGAKANEKVWDKVTRKELRLAMLLHPLRQGPDAELRWFVAATDALRKLRPETPGEIRDRFVTHTRRWALEHLAEKNGGSAESKHDRRVTELLAALQRDVDQGPIGTWTDEQWEAFSLQALWRVCCEGVHGVKSFAPPPPGPIRHRDLLRNTEGIDIDPQVNDLLIRFSAAYLDQGFAHWSLPGRESGFLNAFSELYGASFGPPDVWLRKLPAELKRWKSLKLSPLAAIAESLDELGVPENEWSQFLCATFISLRGWAGMIRQIELRGDRVARPVRSGSLVEFLAVRLLLERLALEHETKTLGFRESLAELRHFLRHGRAKRSGPSVDQRAFAVFQLSQLLGRLPNESAELTKAQWAQLVEEVETFNGIERRRVLHAAFERRFRRQTLNAMTAHAARPEPTPTAPRFQLVCCIDEREESFRRHLEEIEPLVETFGAAGFFCNAMYYRGAEEAHFVPLCPFVIRPSHWVTEKVAAEYQGEHQRRTNARRIIGSTMHQVHQNSRTFAGGALLTAGLGVLATIPMVARVLFPRWTSRVSASARKFVRPPDATLLQLERSTPQPGPEEDQVGFSLEEMANNGERLLRDMGLTTNFAPLVLIVGHGSNSMNNPHKSAYDCGACGGSVGGPNARATAQMLNDDRVRAILAVRGLSIPRDTKFVGGLHDTCNDSMTFFDVDLLPAGHQNAFGPIRAIVEEACDRNAHERCRRFMSAPLNLTFSAARRHVEARSEDLAQTRPEYGAATNAICVVGRRSRTRGLFLDRRAFLTSYDPTQDDAEGAILTRVLGAAVPVCTGISLSYFFSYIDSMGWGSGSKLPHNVTALLGVMDGFSSDLRTGLSWQSVEIHEPVRLLFVVETKVEIMKKILERNPGTDRLCRNGWFQLALLDPDSPQMHFFRNDDFFPYTPDAVELEVVSSSAEWYRGRRDNLGFPAIRPASKGGGV